MLGPGDRLQVVRIALVLGRRCVVADVQTIADEHPLKVAAEYFVDHRSLATRIHAVKAMCHRRRLLLVGKDPQPLQRLLRRGSVSLLRMSDPPTGLIDVLNVGLASRLDPSLLPSSRS